MINKKRYVALSITCIMLLITSMGGCGEKNAVDQKTSKFEIKPYTIEEKNDYLDINVRSPQISGIPDADQLNDTIKKNTDDAIAEVREAADMMEENQMTFSAVLYGDYHYFNNGDIASLWISMDNYTGGAHGLYWLDSYTLNTTSGEIYGFHDLFTSPEGPAFIEAAIIDQVKDQHQDYFPGAEETVAAYGQKFNYLINGNQLVVYFPLYEIAPYAAGIQKFIFSLEDINTYIKPEIIEAMSEQQPAEIPFL